MNLNQGYESLDSLYQHKEQESEELSNLTNACSCELEPGAHTNDKKVVVIHSGIPL